MKFPKDFIWGWAASAPQIEGAVRADGRGPSVWDNIVHKVPGIIKNNDTLDVTTNHYYLYKQDVERLKAMKVPYYSLTMSWSRIFPFGNGTVNKKGLEHYIDEVDYLIANGITPVVTIYHWDMPQALQNAYGGWIDKHVVEDYANYARTVFHALANKVKTWITMNEPQVFCQDYYDWPDKVFPTFNKTALERKYLCGHHAILAHATAVKVFREEIEPKYGKGKIGFPQSWDFTPPFSDSNADHQASNRSMDFTAGWISQPIFGDGEYPKVMRDTLGELLPKFTEEQKKLIAGAADFYAWDSYTGYPVRAPDDGIEACIKKKTHPDWPGCYESSLVLINGWYAGGVSDPGTANWLLNAPDIVKQGIRWSWNKYSPKEYILPEFGWAVYKENDMDIVQARYDTERIDYLHSYLDAMLDLINIDQVNITGCFVWSMMDNLEWYEGFRTRFGLQYVDYTTLERTYKKSAFFTRDYFRHHLDQ
ncbi:hypothetical protein TRVA0_006S00342 [Trichomonascus vanleenenianus]|uniref:glycoside hydrolase family 1 protein n=1 Tax=Trichomonascus vanleenenianus TaxID=2268995 RepID=UPI003ECB00A5